MRNITERIKKGAKKMEEDNNVVLGFEKSLWDSANKLRSSLDSSEYKNVLMGLLFLRYLSINRKDNKFKLPKSFSWNLLIENSNPGNIGKIINSSIQEIENMNPKLKGILPKGYTKNNLDKRRLLEVVHLINSFNLGSKSDEKDILGRVYEYFIGQFALTEGRKGGEFYTPKSVVKLLVEMMGPKNGKIYDPCCGSGGMFVQSKKFLESKGGRINDLKFFGQELNQTTWKLCKINLEMKGIDSSGIAWGDTFHNNLHKDLQADYLIANPPFNMSKWGAKDLINDERWKYGPPSDNNANFAWIQHFIYHLNDNGIAGFVLSNGSLTSSSRGEGEIRKKIIDNDLVECIISLPPQLFYNTPIPCCLWFISKNKSNPKYKNRKNKVLFIEAKNWGYLIDRKHRNLKQEEMDKIILTYHKWKRFGEEYKNELGFCKSVDLDEIKKNRYSLSPGRYVGYVSNNNKGESGTKLSELLEELKKSIKNSKEINKKVETSIKELIRSIKND